MFSVINALEAYTYANILSTGIMGNTPYGFLTGKSDIAQKSLSVYGMGTEMVTVGAEELSLSELVQHPDIAFSTMQSNFASNYQAMAIQSLVTSFSFRFGKKLLRRPISNVNRNIMKPLGVGIKL
jgi:hypothetical protein|tara:strand:+ start:1216 stop:1590 length:375 start_codon:yes stop_codon:yes gene_type:complete